MKHFLILLLLVAGIDLSASVPPPVTGGPSCWPPPCVPIDNGILFLVIAGTLFAAWKIVSARRNSVSQS